MGLTHVGVGDVGEDRHEFVAEPVGRPENPGVGGVAGRRHQEDARRRVHDGQGVVGPRRARVPDARKRALLRADVERLEDPCTCKRGAISGPAYTHAQMGSHVRARIYAHAQMRSHVRARIYARPNGEPYQGPHTGRAFAPCCAHCTDRAGVDGEAVDADQQKARAILEDHRGGALGEIVREQVRRHRACHRPFAQERMRVRCSESPPAPARPSARFHLPEPARPTACFHPPAPARTRPPNRALSPAHSRPHSPAPPRAFTRPHPPVPNARVRPRSGLCIARNGPWASETWMTPFTTENWLTFLFTDTRRYSVSSSRPAFS